MTADSLRHGPFPRRAGELVSTARQVVVGTSVVAVALGVCFLITLCGGLGAGIFALCVLGFGGLVGGGILAGRVDRWFDSRGPAVWLDDRVIIVPMARGEVRFDLTRPHTFEAGWFSKIFNKPPHEGVRSAAEGTWLLLAQDGVEVLLDGDDGTADSEARAVPCRLPPDAPKETVRMRCGDVVALIVLAGSRRAV